jgi:hypothetical protein
MNALGPSWKPKLAGILTPIVPILLWTGLTQGLKLDVATATAVSGAVLGILVSYGLINAKQHDVSNSPTPLVTPQVVATAPIVAVAPPATPVAPVVVVVNPAVTTGGHLVTNDS